MSSQQDYAVILAGGRGERFWPLSTSSRPKQLLSLVGEETLMAQAVHRLEGLIPPERIFVITNTDLVDATCAAVPEVPAGQIIGEPMGRDTAAAVALGAVLVKARDPDAAFCVLTADHIIKDMDGFRNTLRAGLHIARNQDVLITIGMEPRGPSTGYGYIEAGESEYEEDGGSFLKAKRFVEKPDAETAEQYVKSGRYYWNSGMFIWSVSSVEQGMRQHRPKLADMMNRLSSQVGGTGFLEAVRHEYEQLDKISIDYALMEKADNIVMAKGIFDWDDVGSWPALENHFKADQAGNVVIGESEGLDAGANIVYSKNRLTALLGVDNLVVVQAEGVTLICAKDRAQDIKKLVEQVRKVGRYEDRL